MANSLKALLWNGCSTPVPGEATAVNSSSAEAGEDDAAWNDRPSPMGGNIVRLLLCTWHVRKPLSSPGILPPRVSSPRTVGRRATRSYREELNVDHIPDRDLCCTVFDHRQLAPGRRPILSAHGEKR